MCADQARSGQCLQQRAPGSLQADEAKDPNGRPTMVALAVRTVSCIAITLRPQVTALGSSTRVALPDCIGVPQPCRGKIMEANQ
jgi:hypothetical protein